MDRDLHDDMLKLVRFKILFVKREHEYAFPEREDLVSENMDGAAFAAWKTAEFIQELAKEETDIPGKWRERDYPPQECRKNGYLTGLPDEDKKYLRVYYEVLERYPREKFKYEEQQIRILEEIRDQLTRKNAPVKPNPSKGDPFDELVTRLESNKDRLAKWRENLKRCSDPLSGIIANAFNASRDVGEYPTVEIKPQEVRAAFHKGIEDKKRFEVETFDKFAGKWTGTLGMYDIETHQEVSQSTEYRVWDKTSKADRGYVQKVTGSQQGYFNLRTLPDLSENKVDLVIDFYRPEIGITSWASNYQQGRQEVPLIGYQLGGGRDLWVNQMLSEDMKPLFGENIYGVALEWKGAFKKKEAYFLVAFVFDINFDKCEAQIFQGPNIGNKFWKGRWHR